ncbi:MAG: TerC/Alx family metal homeostasis membrane protein [Opitutaceae bacterium]|jgi:tellurite resistance protein TerC
MTPETLLWIIFWSTFFIVSAVDYYVTSHRTTIISVNTALRWTALWVAIALSFGAVVFFVHPRGEQLAILYLSGYLTEYSLSVDNLFVFILIFSLMGVKNVAQPKLIKLGIYLSIVLRIVFILFGIALLHRFAWLIYVFGALLIWTAWKMVTADEEESVHPDKNILYRLASKFLPVHAEAQETKLLFTRFGGKLCITPLFLVFLVIGSTDVLFAIDSIPAIMGISQDPFVVLTSNVFAVLGLNSLFFAIRGIMGLFKFLKHGVSVILFFIGAKMMAGIYHPIEAWFKENNSVSLLVIVSVLFVSIVLSVWHDRLIARRAKDKNIS